MDVPKKVLQYRNQVTVAIIGLLLIGLVSYAAPRFLSILAYFWPLFASTTVFVVAIVAFGGLSQLANEAHGEKAGEGILDYVAARPE